MKSCHTIYRHCEGHEPSAGASEYLLFPVAVVVHREVNWLKCYPEEKESNPNQYFIATVLYSTTLITKTTATTSGLFISCTNTRESESPSLCWIPSARLLHSWTEIRCRINYILIIFTVNVLCCSLPPWSTSIILIQYIEDYWCWELGPPSEESWVVGLTCNFDFSRLTSDRPVLPALD